MATLESVIAGAAIKETIGPAKTFAKLYGRRAYDRFIVEMCNCFQGHVDFAYDRCKYVKNVLYRDSPVDLKSQYVNVIFDKVGDEVEDSKLINEIFSVKRVLISGTAGAGKAMFMKWSVLRLIDEIEHHQRIPLFLELRYIDENSCNGGFVNYLFKNTCSSVDASSLERFELGLQAGQFVLILDAVDEVRPELREKVIEEIRSFLLKYPECSAIISSRPDDELESIQDLQVYRTKNMNLDQIVSVITKLKFDEDVKNSLIKKLQDGLFKEQCEFLSNPLLATIMLVSFDYSAEIPSKLTSFYRQAFEALYQRHDATKGAYRRGHFAGLPLDEYEKIFSAFCFDSFLDSKVQFSDTELIDYFRAALSYYNIESNPVSLIDDARKSVCVIQREGLDNVFAHRTFQEYFSALFLSRYRGADFVDQVGSATFGWKNNNILKMLLEMSPEAVEADFLEPLLRDQVKFLRRVRPNTVTGARKIFKSLYSSIDVAIDSGVVRRFSHNSSTLGLRLSSIGMSYDPPALLNRKIFRGLNVFESLTVYRESNPQIEFPDDLDERIYFAPGEDDNPEETIDVTPEDIRWLMNSNLPIKLGEIRDELISFYDDMVRRISQRNKAIDRMRSRRRNASPIRIG